MELYSSLEDLQIGAPSLTDWFDNAPGPRKCYRLYKLCSDQQIVQLGDTIFKSLTTNVSERNICKLLLLAYQLKDVCGNACFDCVVSHELIKETVEFDDIEEGSSVLSPMKNAKIIRVNINENHPQYNYMVARAYSYLAASYMRLFAIPHSKYKRNENYLGQKFTSFYKFSFPLVDYQLPEDVIRMIKFRFDKVTMENTFYNFLYAGEGYHVGDQLKGYLYRNYTEYTGLQVYVLFLKCMTVHQLSNDVLAAILHRRVFRRELKVIADVFKNLYRSEGIRGKEKQMWRFAWIFNKGFLNDLRAKNCRIFAATLAYLYHLAVPVTNNDNAHNIEGIRGNPEIIENMTKGIAEIAYEKIKERKSKESRASVSGV